MVSGSWIFNFFIPDFHFSFQRIQLYHSYPHHELSLFTNCTNFETFQLFSVFLFTSYSLHVDDHEDGNFPFFVNQSPIFLSTLFYVYDCISSSLHFVEMHLKDLPRKALLCACEYCPGFCCPRQKCYLLHLKSSDNLPTFSLMFFRVLVGSKFNQV